MIADSPPASTQVSKIVEDVIRVDGYSRLAMSDRRLADLREQAMYLAATGMPTDDIDDQIAQEERERKELGTVASDFINALQPAHEVKGEGRTDQPSTAVNEVESVSAHISWVCLSREGPPCDYFQ